MDRLNALNEEDKLAMQAAAAQQIPPGGDDGAPRGGQTGIGQHGADQGEPGDGRQHLRPVERMGRGQQPPHQPRPQRPEGAAGGEFDGRHGAAPRGYPPQDTARHDMAQRDARPTPPRENLADEYRMSDDPEENARLLREKIESLENQIAEISQLNDEKRNQYREELVYRGAQLGKLKEQQELAEEETSYYRGAPVSSRQDDQLPEETPGHDHDGYDDGQGHSAHGYGEAAHDDIYELTAEQSAEADYEYLREQLEPHLDQREPHEQAAPHRPDHDYAGHPYGGHGHAAGHDHQHQVAEWHGQDPHAAQAADASFLGQQEAYYRGDHREEQSPVLPQFLNSPPPSKLMRPKFVSAVGTLVAVLVIGGVAYSFFGQGVSDIVKSDFASLSGEKQTEKLSEIVPQREIELAAPAPAVEETKVAAALTPAQFAAAFKVESLIGVAGQEIALPVSLPELGGFPSAFVMLRDLPEWASVPNGRLVSGSWIVSANDAEALKVKIPDDQPGTFKFEADLVFKPGETPVTRSVNAVIAPASKAAEPKEKAAVVANAPVVKDPEQIKAPEATVSRGPLIIDQALEEKWLERGTRLLRAGDVSAARLAFSHLAEQGSGRGALAMGMTFDPNQPSSRVVAGIEPDVKRARFWYQRALALGNEAAREPLRILGPGE